MRLSRDLRNIIEHYLIKLDDLGYQHPQSALAKALDSVVIANEILEQLRFLETTGEVKNIFEAESDRAHDDETALRMSLGT